MGLRGPKPQSAALKKLKGTYRPSRDADSVSANTNSVIDLPVAGQFLSDQVPEWLRDDEFACAEWRRMVFLLGSGPRGNRTLAEVDSSMLAHYCSVASIAIRAALEVQRSGLMSPATKRGGKMVHSHPALKIAHQARSQALAFAREFGLTPRSRGRPTNEAERADDTEQWLFHDLKRDSKTRLDAQLSVAEYDVPPRQESVS